MGKSLDNALLNLGTKETYNESISNLGFKMEDILEEERDAGLGNGGLGRLAACYMDSLSTLNIPAVRLVSPTVFADELISPLSMQWGYGRERSFLLAPDVLH
jgi:hypothetical protein